VGGAGTPPPRYLPRPVADALEQAVQEVLELGQGLAAQRPVEAEEGEEGDEGQAGAVGVAVRLGDNAQRQELEGKAACDRGTPLSPPEPRHGDILLAAPAGATPRAGIAAQLAGQR